MMTLTPGFTEDWLPVASQTVLTILVDSIKDIPGPIVEVGSWEGRSTVAIANADPTRTVHAVDTWQGSPGEVSADLAADRDVFAQFQTNIDAMTDGNVEAHRMDWRDYIATIREPIAMLFVDGLHTRPEVYATIKTFWPYLAPHAVICGDDFHHIPVRQAVLDLIPDAEWAATLWVWRLP